MGSVEVLLLTRVLPYEGSLYTVSVQYHNRMERLHIQSSLNLLEGCDWGDIEYVWLLYHLHMSIDKQNKTDRW